MTLQKNPLELLTEEMKSQECYKKYQETLKAIRKDEALYDILNEYRKRNVELHFNKGSLKEEAILEKEYREIMNGGLIGEFLHWEQETLIMLRKIHDQVDAALDLDYSFL